MKYYGTFDTNDDLVNGELTQSIISQELSSGTIKEALDKKADAATVFEGTLTAGSTTITFPTSGTSEKITTNSIIDVYTGTYGKSPKNVVVDSGSVTLTFKALDADLAVRVEVR